MDTSTHRRPLLLAVAGGAAAVAATGVAARTGLLSGGRGAAEGPDGVLQLSAGAAGVDSLDVPLGDSLLAATADREWRSGRLPTSRYSMIGFTWRRGEAEPRIDVSVRSNGAWRPWQRMPHAHDAADPAEGASRVGTELAFVGRADGVRVRVRGHRPDDLTLALLHPRPLPVDAAAAEDDEPLAPPAARTSSRAASGDVAVPRPRIRNRREWGADESWRSGSPTYIDTIQQVHVHHTVNSNGYSRTEVPALIRGMYRYHTHNLGWSDVGYNFLVDRFGRIWTGRAGGASRNVRGAHTLGFNATSTGISVIGNYEEVAPPTAVVNAIARVAAWKLARYGRDPQGRTTVRSEGSDRYASGRAVTLPVIDGHRDTNDTACPGSKLYALLPAIRRRTAERIARFRKERVEITEPFTGTGATVAGRTLTARRGSWTPAEATPSYTWLRDGTAIAGAGAASYRLTPADVGSLVSVRVTVSRSGASPATQVVAFPDRVRAQPVLEVKAAGRRGKALVRVIARAEGLDARPTGDVTVTIDGRSRTLPLVDGRVRTTYGRLAPGTYDVVARYAGNEQAASARGTDPVTVK